MVDVIAARNVLYERLCAVLSPDVFQAYASGFQAPEVFKGLPVTEPPFYVAVDDMVSNLTTSGAVSMGHADVTFEISVYAFAQHVDAVVASDTAQKYLCAVVDSVLADHTLNNTVDNSFPAIVQSGCAADSSRRYMAAGLVTVRCEVFSSCPQEIKEAVDAASSN